MIDVGILDALIDSLLVAILFIVSGSRILNSRLSLSLPNIIIFCLLLFAIMFSGLFLDNAMKMTAIYIVTLFVDKSLFKKSLFQSAATALISYLLLSAGEIFIILWIALAMKLNLVNSSLITKGNVFVNLLISLSAYLLLLLTYRKLRKIVTNIKENNKISYICAFSILLIAICALFYRLFSVSYKFNEGLILNLILIIAVAYIGFIIIKQSYDKSKISDEYEKYVEYSKQSEKLVEQYSISQHENKNELIIIRSMVHKTNKKLLEYLDEVISHKDNIENSWIRYLRYIPFGGLKGIIHNKISEMKDGGIKVFLNISNEVEKSRLKHLTMKDNNQLSKIIGVFLDNAKEAALISEEKEVGLCIYIEDKYVVFEISNSYIGTVELDKIYNSGHSSKGKGRGYGLSLVRSIVEDSNVFINETEIINGYFVQKLKVKNEK